MATFQDLMKTVGGAALQGVQAVKKAIPAAQQAIVNWAAQNPSAAGNILQATGGSFGAMLQKSPAQVVGQLAAPAVKQTISNVQKAVAPILGATRAVAAPVKAQTPVAKIITPVAPTKVVTPTSTQQKTTTPVPTKITPTPVPTKVTTPSQAGTIGTSSDYLGQAQKDVAAYYQQLLEDSNWDINEAKRRMEEDYKLGLRGAREASDVEMKQQMTEVAPSALQQSIEDLNKRGLISRPTGDLTPITANLSTGEQIQAKTPNITKTFGGFAGEQFSKVQTAQQARAEAIGKALALREAELSQTKEQKARETEQTAKTEKERIEQEKQVAASKLAAQRYAEKIAGQQAGLTTAYS